MSRFDGTPILGRSDLESAIADDTVEVCESYSYKLNLANHGGPQYESVDLFTSRKVRCRIESRRVVADALFEECFTEVQERAAEIIASMKRKQEKRRTT